MVPKFEIYLYLNFREINEKSFLNQEKTRMHSNKNLCNVTAEHYHCLGVDTTRRRVTLYVVYY